MRTKTTTILSSTTSSKPIHIITGLCSGQLHEHCRGTASSYGAVFSCVCPCHESKQETLFGPATL
jgi:hypothetical protein